MTRASSLALALTSLVCAAPHDDARTQMTAASQGITIGAEEVARGFDNPVYLTAPPGDARLFVVEQPGRIRIIDNGRLVARPFLDITGKVGYGGERGLLSVAFHPLYGTNGFLFVNYTNRNGDTQIERYTVSADRNVVDPSTAKLILAIDQPYSNHNGGLVMFGPDGMLYVGMGDGGSQRDPHNNGQNPNALLGKLLRINVDRGDPYSVPSGNPFASGGGKGEIWAVGLRNPWRFSFDKPTGLLYIGDVGQDKYEEVNIAPANRAGVNYGWSAMDGPDCFKSSTCNKSQFQQPALTYTHDSGTCSIIGGFVYRGRAIPEVVGQYFYSDYCNSWVRSLSYANDKVRSYHQWIDGGLGSIVSFGEDSTGELYICSSNGRVYRIVKRPGTSTR
ncbi:MAG TPA: PQQ-dependent sugar dehydrogenase [Gemmatimonadaceae bacterium]|nr:PQQ-dependent sugar dehydrogenase [Gemmatimonadaceae bacterium]